MILNRIKERRQTLIVKTVLQYSSSNMYRQFLGIFVAFIKPKLLSPELYGLWHILNMIPSYASYSHLGTRSLMRYLIPYHEARKEQHKIREIEGSVFFGSLYLNLFISFAIIALSFKNGWDIKVRLGLITVGMFVIIRWYFEYYTTILKSYQNFGLLTYSNYIKATVACILSVVLIYIFNIYGVYLTVILSHIIVIAYLMIKYPLNYHIKFNYSVFKYMVKKGLPVMVFGLCAMLISTADRILIAGFLGTKQLGYYGIAAIVLEFLMHIPGATREVIEPKLMQSMRYDKGQMNLKEYFFRPLMNMAYFMPFLIGPLIFAIPVLIPLILPKYIPAILPAQVIVLGGYFFSMSYIIRGVIIANNWQLKVLIVLGLVLILNILLNIFFLKLGWGIKGVSIGSSISFCALFMALLAFTKRQMASQVKDWGKNTQGLYLPFPVMCASIMFLYYINYVLSVKNSFISVFFNISVFVLIMYFLFRYAQKRYAIFSM